MLSIISAANVIATGSAFGTEHNIDISARFKVHLACPRSTPIDPVVLRRIVQWKPAHVRADEIDASAKHYLDTAVLHRMKELLGDDKAWIIATSQEVGPKPGSSLAQPYFQVARWSASADPTRWAGSIVDHTDNDLLDFRHAALVRGVVADVVKLRH